LRASALAIVAPGAHVVERRDEAFGELDAEDRGISSADAMRGDVNVHHALLAA
jgi:hypothetical protein